MGATRPSSLMPAQDALIPGSRLTGAAAAPRAGAQAPRVLQPVRPHATGPAQQLPQFLKR